MRCMARIDGERDTSWGWGVCRLGFVGHFTLGTPHKDTVCRQCRPKKRAMCSSSSKLPDEPNRPTPSHPVPSQPTGEQRGKKDSRGDEGARSQDVHHEHADAGGDGLPSARLLHEESDDPIERWGQANGQRKPGHSARTHECARACAGSG